MDLGLTVDDMHQRHVLRMRAIQERDQAITQLQLEQARDLNALAVDDTAFGFRRYVGDELALTLRLSPWTGARLLEEAVMLCDYPCLTARVAEGSWSTAHAQAVLRELINSGLPAEHHDEVLALVAGRTDAITPHQLAGAVRAAIMLLDLEAACARTEKVKTDRNVVGWDGKDGSGCVLIHGPKPLTAALLASLDALIWPKASDDARTASQRRFDAVMDLVCGRIQPGQWQAHVIVALSTLEGDDTQLAQIPGMGAITPQEARTLVTQAGLRRIVVDEHGELIDIDSHLSRPDAPQPAQSFLPAHHHSDQVEPSHDNAPSRPEHAPEIDDRPAPSNITGDLGDQLDHAEVLETELENYPEQVLADGHGLNEPRATADEAAWDDHHLDRSVAYAKNHRDSTEPTVAQPYAFPVSAAGSLPSRQHGHWSTAGYAQALRGLHTRPVTPVDLSTDRYAVPAPLKRWIRMRDHTCTFPGCERPASQCAADHLLPWPAGRTTHLNLASECQHHHLAKHAYFLVRRLPDGTIRWTTPTGQQHDRAPRPLLRGW